MSLPIPIFPKNPSKIFSFPHCCGRRHWEVLPNISVLGIWKKDKIAKNFGKILEKYRLYRTPSPSQVLSRIKVYGSHFNCKLANKFLNVYEQVEMVKRNKDGPFLPLFPVNRPCVWKKTQTVKTKRKKLLRF